MQTKSASHSIVISIIIGMVMFLFGCGSAPAAVPVVAPVAEATRVPTAVALREVLTLAPRVQPATATPAPTPCIKEQYDEKQADGSITHVQYLCDGKFQTQVIATAVPIAPAVLAQQIDSAWTAGDWVQVIALLKLVSPVEACKLYAAYFNYGQSLLASGDKAGAALQFQLAANQASCGGEAAQAVLALTPAPTATATTRPLATATATRAIVIQPTTPSTGGGVRVGAVCRDGTSSTATGSGACSHHGGVAYWVYR